MNWVECSQYGLREKLDRLSVLVNAFCELDDKVKSPASEFMDERKLKEELIKLYSLHGDILEECGEVHEGYWGSWNEWVHGRKA